MATNSFSISFAQSKSLVDIFPIDSKPYGLSYEDHTVNYWRFVLPIETDKNPAEDPTGEHCTQGQNISSSSMFYLHANAGGSTDKTCKIPAGLGLFIPILQVFSSTAEEPGATANKLNQTVTTDESRTVSLYLKINDVQYKYEDLKKFLVTTEPFRVILPPKNLASDVYSGPATIVAGGFHVITSPLSPGVYKIEFGGSTQCLLAESNCANFESKNTYELTVR